MKLGTSESAFCVRIKSGITIQILIESSQPYIPLNAFQDGPAVVISIPPSLCAAVVKAYRMSCATLRELRVMFVTLYICKNLPRLRMKKNKNLKKLSLPIFECQHTVTLGTGKWNAVWSANSNCLWKQTVTEWLMLTMAVPDVQILAVRLFAFLIFFSPDGANI